MTRCDWAQVSRTSLWHAFARQTDGNANGRTQIVVAVCGRGPGIQPYAGIRHVPACATCTAGTRDDGVFTVLRE